MQAGDEASADYLRGEWREAKPTPLARGSPGASPSALMSQSPPFRRVAVYCGSSNDVAPAYFEAARTMGRALAERGMGVVYGAGKVGLMGAVADAALEAGGEVLGVIPQKLIDLEVAHERLSERIVVDSMHARKMVMASLSDAFIALPGGFGTMDEIFEATTWNQLGYHRKPAGFLNVDGYYDHLATFIAHQIDRGFVRPAHRELLVFADTVEGLLSAMSEQDIPPLERWIDRP